MQRLLTGNPLENGTPNIQNLEIPQLQAMVSRYPWFSYAREVLLCKLVSVEPECLESNYKENLIFFPRRDAVLLRCRRVAAEVKKGENAVHVPVKELLDTVEYDYPTFHLSMDCFWAEIVSGDLILKEHDAAKAVADAARRTGVARI